MRERIGLAAAMACLAALAGCTTAGKGQNAEPTAAANDGLGAAPSAPTVNTTKKVTEANFQTPSKNIGCYLSADSARCDIVRKNWSPPPKPTDCDLDWGNGISLYKSEEATFTCAGDTVLGATEVLPYGRSLQSGKFVCDSSSTQIRCENTDSGHGFTLSVQQYNLF